MNALVTPASEESRDGASSAYMQDARVAALSLSVRLVLSLLSLLRAP